jgi:Leucine-rich repeat (LRR) protein
LPDNLLYLKRLECDTTGLRKIPSLQHLEYLECNDCENLTEISELPELTYLSLSRTKVEKLPQYPKLKAMRAVNCLELSRLEPLPLLEELNMPGCTNLKDLPPLMNLKVLYCFDSGFADIDTIDLKNMPKIKRIYNFNRKINFIPIGDKPVIRYNKTMSLNFEYLFEWGDGDNSDDE